MRIYTYENKAPLKLNYSKTIRWEHNGVVIHCNTPAIRSKQASKADPTFSKNWDSPLISLGLLCDDGCTIKLDKKEISVQNNVQEITKGTRNKKTGMWEVTLETQQLKAVINNILVQT